MTKTELIAKIAEEMDVSKKQASEFVNTFLNTVVSTVAEGEKVAIQGFGTFKSNHRPARKGRNPRTGEPMQIEAMDIPSFKSGAKFKRALRK